jgi:CelD/BcsL family acetyltransferase involved in cellulose biosynthesis
VPLLAVITDASTGERAVLLPLILRRQDGIGIVEFADLDLTDYNAPLFGPAAPRDVRSARLMWRDLLTELRKVPGGADLIRLRKLPADLDGRPNPLALLDGAGPCSLSGNLIITGGTSTPGATRWSARPGKNWNEAGGCLRAIPRPASGSPPTQTRR